MAISPKAQCRTVSLGRKKLSCIDVLPSLGPRRIQETVLPRSLYLQICHWPRTNSRRATIFFLITSARRAKFNRISMTGNLQFKGSIVLHWRASYGNTKFKAERIRLPYAFFVSLSQHIVKNFGHLVLSNATASKQKFSYMINKLVDRKELTDNYLRFVGLTAGVNKFYGGGGGGSKN